MDGAKASYLYLAVGVRAGPCGPDDPTSRQVGPVARKALGVILAGAAVVQILVVVANTPGGLWRTDVEKGFV